MSDFVGEVRPQSFRQTYLSYDEAVAKYPSIVHSYDWTKLDMVRLAEAFGIGRHKAGKGEFRIREDRLRLLLMYRREIGLLRAGQDISVGGIISHYEGSGKTGFDGT